MKRILYLTDNSIDKTLQETCKNNLLRVAGDIPIISVSQGPYNLGQNIDVGNIGRSWRSLYYQLICGLELMQPEDICFIAEHDVLYSKDHFDFIPKEESVFYYNDNMLLLEWTNRKGLEGAFSFWPGRLALSQLCSYAGPHLENINLKLELIDKGIKIAKRFRYEPGYAPPEMLKLAERATKGHYSIGPIFDKFIEANKHEVWKSENPNIDIRHGGNFTGPRRGKRRTYMTPYWGTIDDIRKNFS